MKKTLRVLLIGCAAAAAVAAFAACGEEHTHSYGDWVITTAPTASAEGLITRTCSGDSTHTETVVLPALNGTDYTVETVDATCTADGYTSYTWKETGYTINGKAISIEIAGASATGHSFSNYVSNGDATCTADGTKTASCDHGCGETDTVTDEGSATGHSYELTEWVWEQGESGYTASATFTCKSGDDSKSVTATVTSETTEATCAAKGSVVYTASITTENSPTGEAVSDTKTEETALADHTWDSGKVTTAATCTTAGVTTYTCSVCGETKTEEIAATGHTWDSGKVTTAATCTTAGVTTYTCSVCGETKTEEIAATGHKLVATSAKSATCTAAGNSAYYTCSNCGKYFSDGNGTKEITSGSWVIAAKGHSYGTTLTYSATDGKWYETCSSCGNTAAVSDTTGYTLSATDAESLISALTYGGTVQLAADISGNTAVIDVPANTEATIDLNGHTITLSQGYSVTVEGTLTIKDSGSGGTLTIADGVSKTSLIEVDGGKVTLDGGTYSNGTYYGIYCLNGGTAVVNDGTVAASQYGALSGNNTTGDMNFEINGGTISASQGPAIYMPGQGTLTITGGTINGGVSLRMGIVNISGGTINAITSGIDDIKDYYNKSGNIWLADALYAQTGTYTSSNTTYGNKLEINITGGTFNCTNGQGSAVAIYDIGKVEQTVTVNITGGTLNTDSTTRSAYQVLSLTDMGVTSPTTGYGTYSGSVTSSVSGVELTVADADSLALALAGNVSDVTLSADITAAASIDVPAGAEAAIDLNGHTITLGSIIITVEGSLTIDDSGSGSITAANTQKGTAIIQVSGGTVTLNAGTLTSSTTDGYGIYCLNGGTAVINGGTITSSSAPLAGNNTTGDMNFEITGGTLTATYGPAIYMPGQVKLTITGGTLNGGISLRMGIVNISGGTINAITSSIDSPAQYYSYSGNAWLPDALYVLAGTYTSSNTTYGNKLELTITGGTFNCGNNQGSAVAIYNLGKVEQEISVTISGGSFTTSSETRSAYQVITLSDLGVENSTYSQYTNKVTENVLDSLKSTTD